MPTEKPNILFLCTGNACRSQMAEGFAKRYLASQINAYSAGVDPHGMNPNAMAVMAEAGVPIDKQHSKHINDLYDIAFDTVVTVCGHADEACPVLPGKAKRLHHGFDDPPRLAAQASTPQEASNAYRIVRDQIEKYICQQLLNDLKLNNSETQK